MITTPTAHGRPPVKGTLRDERGIAVVLTLIIMSVILFLGTFALVSSRSEIRTAGNYRSRMQAQYFAESGLEEVVGLQNDLSAAPRYLFDPMNYVFISPDSSLFADLDAIDPKTGQKVGTVHRVILDKDPTVEKPPYRLRTTATMNDGSEVTYEVEIDAISLLDFAFYAERSLSSCPPNTMMGRVYTAGNLSILSSLPCFGLSTFMKKVEYVGSLIGVSFGTFNEGHYRVDPYPPLTSLADLNFFRNASRTPDVCAEGVGLFIGTTGGVLTAVKTQSERLFELTDNGAPGVNSLSSNGNWNSSDGEAVTGCKGDPQPGCFQIDLTLFDFAANPITYGGVPLLAGNGATLRPSNFNGVIYVDGELHVWGILGGRSTEDRTVVDTITVYDSILHRPTNFPPGVNNPPTELIGSVARGRPFYHHPDFPNLAAPWNALQTNLYSNNVLDPGEDTNGNGILDAARKGTNLTIVTEDGDDIVIDHNIFYGQDALGRRVTLGLLAGDTIYIDPNSPRVILATGAKIGRGMDTFGGSVVSFIPLPMTMENTHRLNFWAKRAGSMNPADSTYAYDLDADGTLEADNGMGQPGDRNETAMRAAWSALDLGNIVTAGSATYGVWAALAHARQYVYDYQMLASEPPCWPILPHYGVVPGSFTELRN